MTGKSPFSTRNRILDAALAIVVKAGACQLTIDGVAARSKVSKGGVLYHFPDKASLLSGLLDRHMDRQADIFREAEAEHGSSARGRLHAAISVTAKRTNAQAMLPFLGILALQPDLLKRPREKGAHFINELRKDREHFTKSLIVLLANAGLGLSEVLGTIALRPSERKAVFAALHRLVDDIMPSDDR
jgi:AcrR family transcriptional regulator